MHTELSRNSGNLIEVRDLTKHFPVRQGLFGRSDTVLRAVDGVSFSIRRGETLGLVGESGCGKSTTGRLLLRLMEPTDGEVYFDGRNLLALDSNSLRRMRKDMQIIFQDPYNSLNPRMSVGSLLREALTIHDIVPPDQRTARVRELLELVGLAPEYRQRYPHEFSGGQRQRIGIARALSVEPEFIVCDEPVTALDVSIQAQIINLLRDLQKRFNLTYLFIAHDLSVVEHISDRVAVMYLGKIVEVGTRDDVFRNPLHPYTRALMSAVPVPDPTVKHDRIVLQGDVPSPIDIPGGCRFHTRCPVARSDCANRVPSMEELGPGHWVRCYYADENSIN
ncbi:MAG TPA: dipeptide ABC transporter ATP-binding protein [bacterium]|nr:dipeptide ABC transporter ATP-binding protein [bacterium]